MGAFVFEYFDPVKSCIFSVTTMSPEAERQVDEAVCDIFFQLSINTDSVPHPKPAATEEGEGAAAEAGADNNSGADAVRSTMPVLTPPTIATPPRPPPPAMQAPSARPMRPTTSSLPSSLRDEIVRGKSLSPVASRDVGAHRIRPHQDPALPWLAAATAAAAIIAWVTSTKCYAVRHKTGATP